MKKTIDSEDQIEENGAQEIEIEYLTGKKPSTRKKSAEEGPSDPDREKSLKSKLKKKDVEIDRLSEENDKLRGEYLRCAADKDNLRKRLEREKNEFFQYALAELLKEVLAIQDNFERALESEADKTGAGLREGIELIYKQVSDLLQKQGVAPIASEGGRFDPTTQQAFMSEESEEVEEPMVSEELQKGYMIQDRLLRPALVKVAIPKKKEN